MMKIFRDPDQRLRNRIIAMAASILVCVALILVAVFIMLGQVKKMASNQQEIRTAIATQAKVNREFRDGLQDANPQIRVPEISEPLAAPDARAKEPITITIPAPAELPTPMPTQAPTATPSPKPTATPERIASARSSRKKSRPTATPKPWFQFFKSNTR